MEEDVSAIKNEIWKKMKVRLCCGAMSVCLLTLQCFAYLGGDVSTVQADGAHINASLRTTQAQNYMVHELQSPSGATVREYASPAGKVFAVTWKTSARPDLKQLLGPHFEEFQKAAESQRTPGGHAPLLVHLPNLIVELGGHMRSFTGRAYLPDQIPAGVHAEDIR